MLQHDCDLALACASYDPENPSFGQFGMVALILKVFYQFLLIIRVTLNAL